MTWYFIVGSGTGDTASHWMTCYRCFLPDLAGFAGSNCTAPLCLISGSFLRTLSLAERGIPKRREWDSNPRWSFPHTRFPSVLLKPLGHLSKTLRLYHKEISFQS